MSEQSHVQSPTHPVIQTSLTLNMDVLWATHHSLFLDLPEGPQPGQHFDFSPPLDF